MAYSFNKREYVCLLYTSRKGWDELTFSAVGYITKKVKLKPGTRVLNVKLQSDDIMLSIVEVAAPAAGELDLFKAKNGDKTNHELRIVEIEFKENLWQ